MIYMIRDKNTGLYYRHARGSYGDNERKGYWTKTPRTFSQKGHVKLSMNGLLAEYHYRRLGNCPANGIWWSMEQNRAMWNNWKRIADRPLEELLPPEWELIEIDPSRYMPSGEQ